MVELIIQGIRVPLKKPKVTLTKQINNIAELADRQSTFTNKFIAKKTPRLVKSFENLGIVGSLSRYPYKVLGSQLIYNGVQVMENGSAYITNDNEDDYKIAIYDGNIFFFQAIGNTKLNELDFSEYSHELNPVNYIASFTNTSGYIYAVSNNGQFTPITLPEGIQINYQLPAIFVSTIWAKIFALTSFGYSGDIFNTDKFNSLVLSMKRGYNSELDAISNPVQLHYLTISDDITYLIEEEDIVGITYYTWISKWDLGFLNNEGVLNQGTLSILEDSQYTMSWNLNLTNIPQGSNVIASIRETTGGGTVYQNITNNVNGSHNETDSITFTAEAGEHYRFKIEITGTETTTNPYNVVTNVSGVWEMVDATSTLITINISSFIGDMLVKDFVKDIMQHFGLMMQINKNGDSYEFVKMHDLILDTSNAQDLSDKFVKEIGTSYQLKGYAQKNRFAYNYHNKDRIRFADGFLNVGNENLTPEKTHLTRPYNACDTSKTLLNSIPVTLTPFWEADRDDNGVIQKYNPISSKNYLAEVKRIYETIRYNVTGGVGISYTGQVPRLDFSNLSYETIIEENYKSFESQVLNWNNVKDLQFRFNSKDVKDFNFLKLVFIKQLSSYFYFNKIVFKGEQVSKIEAVKITTDTYTPPIKSKPGTYSKLSLITTTYKTTLNGIGSFGKINTFLWELVSFPVGGIATITDSSAISTDVEFNNIIGTWVFRLTVSNDITQDSKEFIIYTT